MCFLREGCGETQKQGFRARDNADIACAANIQIAKFAVRLFDDGLELDVRVTEQATGGICALIEIIENAILADDLSRGAVL